MRDVKSVSERGGLPARIDAMAQSPQGRILLFLLCAMPILSGVVGRIARGKPFFTEYDSLACAAIKMQAGETPYAVSLACPGLHPQPFVYLPQVAAFFAWLNGAIGADAMRLGYTIIYIAAVAIIAWVVFLRASTPGSRIHRMLFLALIAESAVGVGNIAIPIAAMLALAALAAPRAPPVMAAALVLGAVVKPFQITYAAVLALAGPGGLAGRLVVAGLSAGLALAAFAAAVLSAGDAARRDWAAASARMALSVAPGEGIFGWLAPLGLGPPALAGAGLAFAALVALAGLTVAERAGLETKDRVWLGISIATLATPRLMQIDLLLIGPGLLVLVEAARAANPRTARFVSDAVFAGPVLALGLSIVGLDGLALKAASLAFAVALVTTAFAYSSKGRPAPELVGQ